MLPVSGEQLRLREATGADELIVLEPADSPAATVLALARCLTADAGSERPAWDELPAADLGAVALTIRRAWLGEMIRTEAQCCEPDCHERMDIEFTVTSYLDHHRPRHCRGVRAGRQSGWLELNGADVLFRLPTIGDLQVAATTADPESALRQRCVQPATVAAPLAARVSRAMSALAPCLTGVITACCPSCGTSTLLEFDPVAYCIAELRDASAGLYEEVHLLASAFGWREPDILALPRRRRAMYAAMIHNDRLAA